jgi:hypothetical protein
MTIDEILYNFSNVSDIKQALRLGLRVSFNRRQGDKRVTQLEKKLFALNPELKKLICEQGLNPTYTFLALNLRLPPMEEKRKTRDALLGVRSKQKTTFFDQLMAHHQSRTSGRPKTSRRTERDIHEPETWMSEGKAQMTGMRKFAGHLPPPSSDSSVATPDFDRKIKNRMPVPSEKKRFSSSGRSGHRANSERVSVDKRIPEGKSVEMEVKRKLRDDIAEAEEYYLKLTALNMKQSEEALLRRHQQLDSSSEEESDRDDSETEELVQQELARTIRQAVFTGQGIKGRFRKYCDIVLHYGSLFEGIPLCNQYMKEIFMSLIMSTRNALTMEDFCDAMSEVGSCKDPDRHQSFIPDFLEILNDAMQEKAREFSKHSRPQVRRMPSVEAKPRKSSSNQITSHDQPDSGRRKPPKHRGSGPQLAPHAVRKAATVPLSHFSTMKIDSDSSERMMPDPTLSIQEAHEMLKRLDNYGAPRRDETPQLFPTPKSDADEDVYRKFSLMSAVNRHLADEREEED